MLRDYHPALHAAFFREGRIDYFDYAGDIQTCSEGLMRRRGRNSFYIHESMKMTFAMAGGKVRITDFEFLPYEGGVHSDAPGVDAEFKECYRIAVMAFEIDCPRCPNGETTISTKMSGTQYSMSVDPWTLEYGSRKPEEDPGFRIVE